MVVDELAVAECLLVRVDVGRASLLSRVRCLSKKDLDLLGDRETRPSERPPRTTHISPHQHSSSIIIIVVPTYRTYLVLPVVLFLAAFLLSSTLVYLHRRASIDCPPLLLSRPSSPIFPNRQLACQFRVS